MTEGCIVGDGINFEKGFIDSDLNRMFLLDGDDVDTYENFGCFGDGTIVGDGIRGLIDLDSNILFVLLVYDEAAFGPFDSFDDGKIVGDGIRGLNRFRFKNLILTEGR